MQYIKISCGPDVCATVPLIPPESANVSYARFKSFEKAFRHLKKKKETTLEAVKQDIAAVLVWVLLDASFDHAVRMKNQLGFIIILIGKQKCANNVKYDSARGTEL